MTDAGWYPDPDSDPPTQSYWDGERWVERGRPIALPPPAAPDGGGGPTWWQLLLGGLALLALVAVLSSDEGGGGDDGDGGRDAAPFKTDAEIEREIANSLDKKPYNELLFTPLTIDCSGISENLKANRDTRCEATDSRGSRGSFKVEAVGKSDYEFSPGEVTQAVSF
jgi:hypothetical protein